MQRAFVVWLTRQAPRNVVRSKKYALQHVSYSSTSGSEQRRLLLDECRSLVKIRPCTVKARLPCDLRVTAIDVEDSDTVAVSLFAMDHDYPENPKLLLEEGAGCLSLSLTGYPMSNEKDLPHRFLCTVQLPARLTLQAELTGAADIVLEKLEFDSVLVASESGDIHLRNVKAGEWRLGTVDGQVRSEGRLSGDFFFNTRGSGCLEAEVLIGNIIRTSSVSGSQRIDTAYASHLEVTSRSGCLNMGMLNSSASQLTSLSGDIAVGHLFEEETQQRRHSLGFLPGGCSGTCQVSTDSGSVRLVAANPGVLNVTTGSGDVTLILATAHRVSINNKTISPNSKGGMLLSTADETPGECGQASVFSTNGRVHLQELCLTPGLCSAPYVIRKIDTGASAG